MSFQPPKGTFDVLPGNPQAVRRSGSWSFVLAEWERWSTRFGYPLVMTPIFEATDLFERSVGGDTEVVTKQMYTFEDKGGRSITLRPEGTAGVVRAYLNAGGQGAWKGAYSGPMFRYERPQKGRYRQFWQVGVEYLDVSSPVADAEVIELGFRFLGSVGVPGLEVRLNSLGDQQCRPGYLEELGEYLNARFDALCDDSRDLVATNPLRVLDCKVCAPHLEDAPAMTDHLCDQCREHFAGVLQSLEALGIPFQLDPRLVRGLDYYTRTAFEYIAGELDAAQNAVGGGGRYDGLAETIGGRPVPGIGFALGIDRIIITLPDNQIPEIEAYLVSEGEASVTMKIASALRGFGVKVDFDSEGRSVKAQFKSASRSGAPFTILVRSEGLPLEIRSETERIELPLEEVSTWIESNTR